MVKKIKYLSISIFLAFLSVVSAAATSRAYLPTSGAISVLNQNPTGVLSPASVPQASGLMNLGAISIDPSGKFIYALTLSNGLYTYAIDPARDGALSQVDSPLPTDTNPIEVVFNGNYAYIPSQGRLTNSGSIALYNYNSDNGVLTLLQSVSNTIGNPNGMVIDSTGKYAYVTTKGGAFSGNQILIFGINSENGFLQLLGTELLSGTPAGIVADKNGHIYVLTDSFYNNGGMITSFRINSTNGSLTKLSNPATINGANVFPSGLTLSPDGAYAYVTISTTNVSPSINTYSVDTTTGFLSYNRTTTVAVANNQLASLNTPVFDPTGQYMYVTAPYLKTIYTFNFDSGTGALSPLSQPQFASDSILGSLAFN